MPKAADPELKKVDPNPLLVYISQLPQSQRKTLLTQKYMDKRLFVQLNGSRKVIGVLRGYDVRSSFLAIGSDVVSVVYECRAR